MIKVSLLFLFSLICNGCLSSSSNNSIVSNYPKPTQKANNHSVKYSTIQGCKLLKSGYMICPKNINR